MTENNNNKKNIILRLPEGIYKVIKIYKDKTGLSITNIIYNAIVWWCLRQGLISLEYLKGEKK